MKVFTTHHLRLVCRILALGGLAISLIDVPSAYADIINVTITSDGNPGANISDTLTATGVPGVANLTEAQELNGITVQAIYPNKQWTVESYTYLFETGEEPGVNPPGDVLVFANVGNDAMIEFGSDDEAGNLPDIPIPTGVKPKNGFFNTNNSFSTTAQTTAEPTTVFLFASGLIVVVSIGRKQAASMRLRSRITPGPM